MKLTKQQIEALYKFTRQHYVYHYDVQTELVDHLANDIEQVWEENSKISFEEARDKSFKKFGVFGFMDVIEAKQKQMNKRYWKILWRFTKDWFTFPKIVMTLGIFLSFYMLMQIKYSEYLFIGTLLMLVILELIQISLLRKKQKEKKKKEEKVFLLEAMLGTTQQSYTGLAFINILNIAQLIRFDFSSLAIHWVLIISIVLTLLCILFYVINYVIPQKAEELLQETYPEYNLVKNL